MKFQDVGGERKFTFSENLYKVREILETQNIQFPWEWSSGVCPHCKKKITRTINHIINRIEILGIDNLKDNELKENDIIVLGFTLDNRTMLIPKEKYKEILNKTTKFKNLIN